MINLINKNNKFIKEIQYSIVLIIIYFILVILANILSDRIIKIPNSINALVEIIFPIIVITLLKRKKLLSYYGINSLKKLEFKNLLKVKSVAHSLSSQESGIVTSGVLIPSTSILK